MYVCMCIYVCVGMCIYTTMPSVFIHLITNGVISLFFCGLVIKNEIVPFVTTCMDIEDIMLNKVSQRKTITVWSILNVEPKEISKKQSHRYREQIGSCQSWVVGGRNGSTVSFIF